MARWARGAGGICAVLQVRSPGCRRRGAMEISIETYGRLGAVQARAAEAEIRDIFFLSAARRDFADARARADFAARWLEHYLTQHPDLVFLARAEGGGLAGYLTGCADSAGAAPLFRTIPHFALFQDLFPAYPAHLHLNCRPEARSRGIGAALVEAFVDTLVAEAVPGVHVVTLPAARNATFYRRNSFTFEAARTAPDGPALLFLGRKLMA